MRSSLENWNLSHNISPESRIIFDNSSTKKRKKNTEIYRKLNLNFSEM